jgi:hypothetical protein
MLLLFDDGNIYMTNKTGNTFSAPVMLDEAINSKDQEIAASITRDGNAIYFASNRKGGYGGTDIYVSRKLPIGGWGPPQNLGEEINTPFDEDFPNISPDGLTLYFSSKGHTSMGGYDIFTSKYNATTNKFEIVRNIGYPLNTVNDDMNFRVSETGRYGYIAALKPNGLGDLDIYRVTFNEIEPSYTVIKGLVRSKDPNMTVDDILISVVDKKTGDDFGAYVPNRYTMRYIMILPPGKYTVMIDADGFTSITEDIEILDKSSFESEIDKDIILVPNK